MGQFVCSHKLQQNSYYLKMSFFERMMKINNLHAKQHSKQKQSIYHEEETAPNQQQHHIQQEHQPLPKQSSMKSSIAIKLEEQEQIADWEELAEQPKIKPVYVTKVPVLLHHLLPKREQLMRQMLMKKQLQARRRVLCEQKKNQLQIKIEEDSLKFKNSLIKHPKRNSIKQQVKINEMAQSQISEKLNTSQVRKYSLKNVSGTKQSKVLVLNQSVYSVAHPQSLGSPVADAFNRQIMLKLLNIIQKDRQSVALKTSVISTDKKERQRDAPIIINNIMKTPHQNINKDLIDRELKITILENTRLQRQKLSVHKNHNVANTGYKSIVRGSLLENQERGLTERSNHLNKVETVDFEASLKRHNSKSIRKENQVLVDSSLVQMERSSNKDKKGMRVYSNKKKQKDFQLNDRQELDEKMDKQNSSTKFNSSDRSTANQAVQKRQIKNKRQFQKIKKPKKESDTPTTTQKKQEKLQNKPKEVNNQTTSIQEYKPPVRIQIPLQNKSEVEGLTLAEAFKKKIGRLRSETAQPRKKEKAESKDCKIKQMPSQMTITITQKLSEYNSNCDLQRNQSTNLPTEDFPSKRTFTSKHLSKKTSLQKDSLEDRSNSKLKEPSADLVNRLIYGAKAKVSKEEMYALTRKNYANLPQVQAKKKQQQKRKAQQQRLTKAKQYQKAIRVGRSAKQL